jgi:chromosome segregation ATPase
MTGAVAVTALAAGCLLVASDLQARTEMGTVEVSTASVDHQLNGLRAELARADGRLAGARSRRTAVTRSFDAAQTALSTTQATLAKDQAGIQSQGIDLGVLDSCLSAVEEALNQIAVGQTAGGLASLQASSASCSALDSAP